MTRILTIFAKLGVFFCKLHIFRRISKFSCLNVFEEVAPQYSATWWRYFSASCRHDVTNLCHQNPSVIWSDLSKLTYVMFEAFAKKKYAQHKIAYVTRKNSTSRSFLKMTSTKSSSAQLKLFLGLVRWTPIKSNLDRRVTFLNLVIQLSLTLLFLSFEIIQFYILILRYKDFTALLSLRLAWSISHPLQLKDWLDSFYLGTVVLYQLFKLYHCNSISDHGKTGSGPEISSFAKMKGSKKSRTLRTLPGKCPVWRNANWINFVRCFPNQIFNNFRASFRAVSEPSFWTVLFMSVHFTF